MKKLCCIILFFAVIFCVTCVAIAQKAQPQYKVIAYYFHGTFRCVTCTNMEKYSREAIETNFKDALTSGKLEFKAVNVEEHGNEHFVNDYQLYTKTLILSLAKDGKEIKWKNMNKIWEYVRDKERFTDYVKSGVADLLKEAQ